MSGTALDWRARLTRELRAAGRLTVLGVGNPDRGDDGAGSRCVRRLARALGASPLLFRGGLASDTEGQTPARRARPGESPRGPFLAKLERVQVLDGREAPESLTGPIRRFRPSHVLIVDAVSAGNPPGTVFFVDPSAIPEDDLSTHRIPLSHLVRYLEETVGCRVLLLGIEPKNMGEGKGLTRPVSRAAADLADALAGWMRPQRAPALTTRTPSGTL